MPNSATVTNRSKRPSNIQLAATLRKIRHLLAEGYTNREIIEMLAARGENLLPLYGKDLCAGQSLL